MLTELHVEAVGIFQDATIEFGPGLTVVTGETGAGKTLLVESLGALLGRRTDVHIIGPGAENARIDGRFQTGDVECILSRVITPQRSKAYVDLRPATLHALTERAHDRMSMTGQGEIATGFTDHALRVALSRVDAELGPIEADYSDCWTRRRKLEQRIAEQGGDEREIAQMIDLYEYQLRELTVARLDDPEEFNALEPLIEALREHDEVRRGIEIASRALTESAGD
ncbi:MAG: AAA family ATPase, partial [Acidimicrobiia bacterium]